MKTVYISGKVTGRPIEEAQEQFREAELKIKKMGYNVINPTKHGIIDGYEWADYMKQDIKLLCDCDYIYQLPNWEESKGAKLEYQIAIALSIPTLKIKLV